MNIKIIIGIGILIALVFGFVFLNLHYEPENKQNLSTNNTENTSALKNLNHSIIKIEENKSIINKINISQENFSENVSTNSFILSNNTCKKYILKINLGGTECTGDVCTTKESIEETPIYTKIKGIEEIEGKKYIVVESNPFIDKNAFLFDECNLTSTSTRYIFKILSETCPPQCEKIVGKIIPEVRPNPEDTISEEYVDIETGKTKIIAIPIVTKYKLENNTLYERKEIFQDGKVEYNYNFTDYTKYSEKFYEFFHFLFGLHPLYVPGFIKNFEMHNITASRSIKDEHTECSEDIKSTMEGYNGEKIGFYECTETYTVNYIGNIDMKTTINKTYTENVSFGSPTRENPVNPINAKQAHIAESLVWEEMEKVNGKEGYKIIYVDKNAISEERYTVWIDDKGMLLGIKKETRYTYQDFAAINGGWHITHTYMLVDESDSCDI